MDAKLLALTEAEDRVVQDRLGVSVDEAIKALWAAYHWAIETTTPQYFETDFPAYVATNGLNQALAAVAADFVLTFTASDEEQEIDERGLELMFARKPDEEWTEADKQTWVAFMESCKKENEQASASLQLAVRNVIDRDTPTTPEEVEEIQGLAHLREWARTQIN